MTAIKETARSSDTGRRVPARVTNSRPAPHKARRRLARAAGYSVLIVVSAVSVIPLVWMVLTSLKRSDEVFNGKVFPEHVSFSAYSYIWNEMHIWGYFLNSVLVTLMTVVAVVVVASLAGYAFASLRVPFKGPLYVLLMSALFVPAAIILIPAFLELRSLGLLDTRQGLALVYIGTGVPFAVLLMRVFFEGIPRELHDAATVDGAGEFYIFRKVVLPLAGPGVATVAIFQVLFTWNELMFANGLIQSQSLQPLQPALYTLVGAYSTNWPALTAALTVAVVPIIVFYVRMQKLFVAGITAGSLKG